MNNINANDIYSIGKVKSEIAFVLWQLQTDQTYSKDQAAVDLKNILKDVIDFEQYLTEQFMGD